MMMMIGWLIIGFIIYHLIKDRGVSLINSDSNAESRLKERYVNGEIDEETYIRMKKNN